MPETHLRIFQDDDGSVPFWEWLDQIQVRNRKAYEKCRSYVTRLQQLGHELRRPTADLLRDGVYELRIRHQRVNYRILYGFVGQDVVLISHGLTKEKRVPVADVDKALERLAKYRQDPDKYGVESDA